jgi:transposase
MWQDIRRTEPQAGLLDQGHPLCDPTARQRPAALEIARSSGELKLTNQELYAGWLLVEQLRGVYVAHDHDEAIRLLDDWILAALESDMEPFVRTALTLDVHRAEIANAIALGLSSARLEGMNSTVRLIGHRARGFRRLESLLSMLTLVCGRIPVALPT